MGAKVAGAKHNKVNDILVGVMVEARVRAASYDG